MAEPFILQQPVLFRHCDPAGIVFYPRYFEMLNDTVEAFFGAIGLPFHEVHDKGAVPTAQIAATFKAPSRHGDMLAIALRCRRIGRSSLELAYTVTCGGETRLTAASTLVLTDATGRPHPWPDTARAALSPHIEGH